MKEIRRAETDRVRIANTVGEAIDQPVDLALELIGRAFKPHSIGTGLGRRWRCMAEIGRRAIARRPGKTSSPQGGAFQPMSGNRETDGARSGPIAATCARQRCLPTQSAGDCSAFSGARNAAIETLPAPWRIDIRQGRQRALALPCHHVTQPPRHRACF